MLHLLIAVNNDNPAILTLLVPLEILLQFLLPLVVRREERGDHGGLLAVPIHARRGGVELVLGEFGVAAAVLLPLLLVLPVGKGLLLLRAVRMAVQRQLELLDVSR